MFLTRHARRDYFTPALDDRCAGVRGAGARKKKPSRDGLFFMQMIDRFLFDGFRDGDEGFQVKPSASQGVQDAILLPT